MKHISRKPAEVIGNVNINSWVMCVGLWSVNAAHSLTSANVAAGRVCTF